jgi:hypothetical protein
MITEKEFENAKMQLAVAQIDFDNAKRELLFAETDVRKYEQIITDYYKQVQLERKNK